MTADTVIAYPAAAGGLSTRILEAGEGDREMWLIHGLGGRADRWLPSMPLLARAGYRVRSFDLIGHGFADKGAAFPYSVRAYVDFVTDLVHAYSASYRVVLVGTSFGGHISAGAAVSGLRNRLSALVLAAPTGIVPVGPDIRDGMADRLVPATRMSVRRRLGLILGTGDPVSSAWVEEEYRINISPGAQDALTRLANVVRHDLDRTPLAESLAALRPAIPTLVLWGEKDRSLPADLAGRIASEVPAVRTRVMLGAGHLPYFQTPDAFCGHVLDFLASAEGECRVNG